MALSESLSPLGLGFMFHPDTFHDFMMLLHRLLPRLECPLSVPTGHTPTCPQSTHSVVTSLGNLPWPPRTGLSVLFRAAAYRPRHGLLPSSFPLFISVLPHTLPSFTSSKSLLKYHFLQETIFHHPIENYFAQDIPHTLLSFTCLLTYFLLSTPHQDVHSLRAWIQVCLGHCCNLSI